MSRSTFLALGVAVAASSSLLAARAAHAGTNADTTPSTTGAPAPERTGAIVGGSDVPAGKWPDTVAVLGETGVCTGTLIAPDVVLTAGHCADITPKTIIANTTNYAQSGGLRVTVAQTIAYPNWENTYDVAVVVLSNPITSITPRLVGTSCTFNEFTSETPVRLVGFGATDMQGETANSSLKEAMTAVTDPNCATGGQGCNPSVSPGGEFVAGGTGNADSCFGDSGGPVLLETSRGAVLVGAVSRGVNNAATPCGAGGIYVRTDKIIDWIEETTGKTIAKDTCDGADTYGTDGNTGSGSGSGSGTEREGDEPGDDAGGCSAGSSAGRSAGTAFAFGAMLLALARRRRTR